MDIICYLPDAIGAKHKKPGFHDENEEQVGGIGEFDGGNQYEQICFSFLVCYSYST